MLAHGNSLEVASLGLGTQHVWPEKALLLVPVTACSPGDSTRVKATSAFAPDSQGCFRVRLSMHLTSLMISPAFWADFCLLF